MIVLVSWKLYLLTNQIAHQGFCIFNWLKLWRWLPHRWSKSRSQTTALLRTPIIQMIFFNHGMLLLGSNRFLIRVTVSVFLTNTGSGKIYDLPWPYFSPEVMVKFTKWARGHFVTLIGFGVHLIRCNPGSRFSKVPKLFGRISGDIMLFCLQNEGVSRHETLQLFYFLPPLEHLKGLALQSRRVGVLRMAFRARKFSRTLK